MKTIIAGCRWIEDYELVKRVISRVLEVTNITITEVVSGKARGVDSLGEKWAKENHIPVIPFHADWKKYGDAAGLLRNKDMGNYADMLIAIWDDKSTGTKDMMDYMDKLRKPKYWYSPLHTDPVPMLFNFFN